MTVKFMDEEEVHGEYREGVLRRGYYHGLGTGLEAVCGQGGRGLVDSEKDAKKTAD